MCTNIRVVSILVASLFLALFTSTQALAQSAEDPGKVSNYELTVSPDGSAILDQNGGVIARFAPGMNVQATSPAKLAGCMRCWDECIIYEGETCVKTIQTCQWDFDCKK